MAPHIVYFGEWIIRTSIKHISERNHKEIFITLNIYIIKEEMSKTNDLSFHLKKLEQKNQL